MNQTGTKLSYFGLTDIGQVRDHNEDSFVIIDLTEEAIPMGLVMMVADGMGGANAGEVASAIACKVIEERFLKLKQPPANVRDTEKYLKNLILEAHQQIVQHAYEVPECEGMGTTVVLAWFIHGYMHVVWCGDSRCYVYKKNQQYTLSPFTDDHSLVWQMVQHGELTAEEARVHEQSNIILQVLGSTDAAPSPSYQNKKLEQGEKILLCSDGLNGMLSDATIQQILEEVEGVEAVCDTLVKSANQAGGTDNITVLYGEVEISGTDIFSDTDHVAPNAGKNRKWLYVFALTVLIAIVIFAFIAWNTHKPNKSGSNNKVKEAAVPSHAEPPSVQKVPLSDELPKNTETKASSSVQKNDIKNEDTSEYDFHTELLQLNLRLENQILNTKKLLAGCKECDNDPKLENINESLAATQEFIHAQMETAHQEVSIQDNMRDQLAAISQKVNVTYDTAQIFDTDPTAEQVYIINTLDDVIFKISERLEVLTSKVQEKK